MIITLPLHVTGLYVYVNNCAAGQRLPGPTLARAGKVVPAPVDPETEDVQRLRDHLHSLSLHFSKRLVRQHED